MDSKKIKMYTKKIKRCDHHIDIVEGYVEWHNWAELQIKKGMRQMQCPDCLLYFFPEEMGVKKSD